MKAQWLTNFCAWLEQTWPSLIIQQVFWIIPMVQTVHILAIAMVLASATMITGRLFGWLGMEQTPRKFAARYLPFIWWPLVVLFLSGIVMIVGEPARELTNGAFQLKMLMVLAAIMATRVLERRMAAIPGAVDAPGDGAAPMLGGVAVLLWAGIIFVGRWIAYYT
jgi:cation transport ATPase